MPSRPSSRPHLLVIGASPGREAAFAQWQRMGLHVTVVDGDGPNRYDLLADESYHCDVRDETADTDGLLDLAATADGVVCLADGSQRAAAVVAAERGLPGPGVVAAEIARSKYRQREALRDAGLDVPVWTVVRGPADIDEYFAGRTVPSILKPADSSASSAVKQIHDAEAAKRVWPLVRHFTKAGAGVLEEYIDGPELSVEAAVVKGRVGFTAVTRKSTTGAPSFVELGHTIAPPKAEPLTERAEREVARVAAAFAVQDGLVHAEFKYGGGRWRLIEAAVRPGGDHISELVKRSHLVDLYQLQALIALGEPVPESGDGEYSGIRYAVGRGVVRGRAAPRTCLAELRTVRIAVQILPPGQRVGRLLGSWDRLGFAMGWSSDPGVLDRELGVAVDRMRIKAFDG